MILKSAQKIMAPYKIEYTYCDWWTAYQIGQRVGSKFSKNERIFLAGDAVHVSVDLVFILLPADLIRHTRPKLARV